MAFFLVGKDNSSFFSKRTTWELGAALEAANEGDVIEIEDTYCLEGLDLFIHKNISLIGKMNKSREDSFPQILGAIFVDNCTVHLENIIIRDNREESNALNLCNQAKVYAKNVLIENQLVEGELYPLCFIEESELSLEDSFVRAASCIAAKDSTLKFSQTDLYSHIILEHTDLEIAHSKVEVEGKNAIVANDNSNISILDSTVSAQGRVEDYPIVLCRDSQISTKESKIIYLHALENYTSALYLENSKATIDSTVVNTFESKGSKATIHNQLCVLETAMMTESSQITGDALVIGGRDNGKVNLFLSDRSSLELKLLAIGVEKDPDIKIERGSHLSAEKTVSILTNEEQDILLDSDNQLMFDDREVTTEYYGEKTASERLEEMIGLENLKSEVKEFIAISKMNKIRKEKGFATSGFNLHSLFLGNPGTGKTTVARLMGQLLHENGIIASSKYVETSRSNLVGQYIGHTAQKTKEILESALGGVLFIDEAYTLAVGGENDFGIEAINEILKFMEDHREDLVIIFAGYTKDMERFLEMNEGLRSRIPNTFVFEDYTYEQLVQIGLDELAKNGYTVDAEAYKALIENNLEKTNDHSNGRWVRNQNEKILRKLAVYMFDNGLEDLNDIPNAIIKQCMV